MAWYNPSTWFQSEYDPNRLNGVAQQRNDLQNMILARSNQAAPTLDPSANAARGQQMDIGSLLLSAAQGQGPSAAELQLQRGLGQQLAGANALAAGSRGVAPGLAMQIAQQSQARAGSDFNANQAILRAQEMQAARAAASGHFQGMRGQDIGAAQANLQAGLQQQGINQGYTGQAVGLQGQALSQEQMLMELERQKALQAQQNWMGLLNAGARVGTGIATMGASEVAPAVIDSGVSLYS